METCVKREAEKMGFGNCPAINGRIFCEGSGRDILKLNMGLRTAERVMIVVAEGKTESFDELYERAFSADWKRFLPKDAKLLVSGKCVKSKLFSANSCQKIVKKAVVDKLGRQYAVNSLTETGAEAKIVFALHEDELLLTLDTSGEALHKRGYRDLSVQAPIKETIAAGIVMLSDWGFKCPLVDLCCGSGTIPVEAAMYAANIAPNKGRSFAFDKFENALSEKERNDIIEEFESKEYEGSYDILGRDIDSDCVSISVRHAKRAGVGDMVRFEKGDAADFRSEAKGGTIISNLPYGERLMTADELFRFNRSLGRTFSTLDYWSGYFLTASLVFEKEFGRPAAKKRKLYNGDIECRVYTYYRRCGK